MNWIVFALLAAFFSAVVNITNKKTLINQSPIVLLWWASCFALPILITSLFITGIPTINQFFWPLILVVALVGVLIELIFLKGVQLSPISLVMPFTAFTPLVVTVSSFLLLHETPNPLGIVGIILIVLGAYLITIQKPIKISDPFRQVFKERGILLIIASSVLWGITIPLGKLATQYSSANFFSVIYMSLFLVYLFPIYLKIDQNKLTNFRLNYKAFSLIGVASAFVIFFTWQAISQGLASYANSIISTRILLIVLAGGYFLKEGSLKQRLLASSLMVLGVILIIFNK